MLEGMVPQRRGLVNIRERVLLWRHHANITQRELSKRSGLNIVYIAYIETGRVQSPRLDTLEKIAEGLGISTQQFLFGDPKYPEIPTYDDGYRQAMLDTRDFVMYKLKDARQMVSGKDKDRRLMLGLTSKVLLDPDAMDNFQKYGYKAKYRVYDDGTIAEIL